MKKNFLIGYCWLFSLCCLPFLLSCSKEKTQQALTNIAVPVTIAPALVKEVPVRLQAIGNAEAYSTVSIIARVGGELIHVNFNEGQYVKKGDLLFKLDPRPYKTLLDAAEANLARDSALAKKANDDVERYTELFEKELASKEDYERVRTNAAALKATLDADRAAVENAKLQLYYCSIYAPLSGRTGSLLVYRGNLIKANDDKPMVVINQLQPIYVTFSVPEQDLQEIKKYMASGKLKVAALIPNEASPPEEGLLTFIDNTVDASTGTIKLKATFPNNDKKLWPGQFVNVAMTLSTKSGAVVVPSQAVQTGQQGQYIFIVKDDLTVEQFPVEVARTIGDEAVIASGLKGDEKVVIDGQIRLMPGAKVEIKNASESVK